MKILQVLCALMLSSSSLPLFACELPSIPDIQENTRWIQRDTERYFGAMVDYIACIEAELRAVSRGDGLSLQRTLLVRRNNAAVAEVNVIMNLYVDRVGPIEDLRVHASTGRAECLGGLIRKTEIVDDGTILFFLLGGRIFLNNLNQSCPGLKQAGTFAFPGGRCVGANIQFRRGLTDDFPAPVPTGGCKLGLFFPISEDRAEELMRIAAGEDIGVRMEAVEFTDEDETD